MPFTRLRQSLIQPNGSITGSLLGTASYAITSSYALNGGTLLTTGSTYPITSSWSNSSISSSYALTASFALNTPTNIINWTGSNFKSDLTTQSVAIFDSSGLPSLVTPTEDNMYLVIQNGIMKWIPIATAVVSFLNSALNEEQTIVDGSYQNQFSQPTFVSFFNEDQSIIDGAYETQFSPPTFVSSFTSGSI